MLIDNRLVRAMTFEEQRMLEEFQISHKKGTGRDIHMVILNPHKDDPSMLWGVSIAGRLPKQIDDL